MNQLPGLADFVHSCHTLTGFGPLSSLIQYQNPCSMRKFGTLVDELSLCYDLGEHSAYIERYFSGPERM